MTLYYTLEGEQSPGSAVSQYSTGVAPCLPHRQLWLQLCTSVARHLLLLLLPHLPLFVSSGDAKHRIYRTSVFPSFAGDEDIEFDPALGEIDNFGLFGQFIFAEVRMSEAAPPPLSLLAQTCAPTQSPYAQNTQHNHST